jgi:general nucleoside transport system permease protein
MSGENILIGLAGVLAATAPFVFAVVGETITERAGVINLSLNGLILLSAMGSFAVAVTTNSLLLGFLAGAGIGAAVALVIAFCSITLRQSQVAVGFVLALLCRDLSYFLGNPFMNRPGPVVPSFHLPHALSIDLVTVLSIASIFVAWAWLFKTRPGLVLRGLGEQPAAAYVRGASVNRLRYFYTILGGAVVGLAGPAYSLSVKAGWRGTISGLDGIGWIALAIVVFGGWNPVRAALGAYLFGLLQWLGVALQPVLPGVPSQVLQVAPFPVMILTLLFVSIGNAEWVARMLVRLPPRGRSIVARALRSLEARPPASLGVPFET